MTFAMSLMSPCLAFGQAVAITGDAGFAASGVLRSRGNQCFVITAAHVASRPGLQLIGPNHFRTTVVSVPRPPLNGITFLESAGRPPRTGIAILEAEDAKLCSGSDWKDATDSDYKALLRRGTAVLRMSNGLIPDSIEVRVTGAQDGFTVGIEPVRASQEFASGMSGAGLYVNGAVVGILDEVDAATGRGYCVDLRSVKNALDTFFGVTTPPPGTRLWPKKTDIVFCGVAVGTLVWAGVEFHIFNTHYSLYKSTTDAQIKANEREIAEAAMKRNWVAFSSFLGTGGVCAARGVHAWNQSRKRIVPLLEMSSASSEPHVKGGMKPRVGVQFEWRFQP